MSPIYYYNKNTNFNNNHEVHTQECSWLPGTVNYELIGFAPNCKEAVKRAERQTGKNNFEICHICCRD